MQTLPRVRRVVAVLVAAVCAVLGAVGLARADDGLDRRAAEVDGVPLEVVRPAGADGPLPGLVVAHGFAGSTPLMRGFADTAARAGYAVVLLDGAGHGANRRPFDGDEGVDADVRTALAHLRAQPGVDPGRTALLGHSMGAGAVLRVASADPAVRATVAISTGPPDDGRPGVRNLLVLAGALEPARIRGAGPALVRAVAPDAAPGATGALGTGDPATGTARRAEEVPGVEHVSVLFADRTHRAALDWLDAALRPGAAPAAARPLQRAGPALLLHLAAALAFPALAALVLGGRSVAPTRPPSRVAAADHRRTVASGDGAGGGPRPATDPGPTRDGPAAPPLPLVLLAPVLAAVVAVLLAGLVPQGWLPIAVADHAIAHIGAYGLALLLLERALGRRRTPRPVDQRRGAVRLAAAAAVLGASAVIGFVVPAQLGWAHAVPGGVRVALLVPAVLAGALLAAGAERLARGRSGAAAVLVHAWTALVVVLALAAAVPLAGAPPFVLFVVPLFGVLLAWQGATAAGLRAARAPVALVALVGGLLLGWPLATTFPVTAG